MKIQPQPMATLIDFPSVREKQDGGAGNSPQHSGEQPSQKKQKQPETATPPEELEVEATPEKVDQALIAFRADPDSQTHHLEASREGNGPGLKVVLKDGSGSVIRQFTGEEFLKLQKSSTQSPPHRGKLLDRKL